MHILHIWSLFAYLLHIWRNFENFDNFFSMFAKLSSLWTNFVFCFNFFKPPSRELPAILGNARTYGMSYLLAPRWHAHGSLSKGKITWLSKYESAFLHIFVHIFLLTAYFCAYLAFFICMFLCIKHTFYLHIMPIPSDHKRDTFSPPF